MNSTKFYGRHHNLTGRYVIADHRRRRVLSCKVAEKQAVSFLRLEVLFLLNLLLNREMTNTELKIDNASVVFNEAGILYHSGPP